MKEKSVSILEKLFKNHLKGYCERPEVGCGECSLVNYGLDCRNYPVAMEYGDTEEKERRE